MWNSVKNKKEYQLGIDLHKMWLLTSKSSGGLTRNASLLKNEEEPPVSFEQHQQKQSCWKKADHKCLLYH